ncbi:uncharacterized protein [Antedon mediterranea]|uniref:uncharacterized protein n=1 Tax=Antedon mediterranea TaxID=105859 RepID=UPI003AF8E730
MASTSSSKAGNKIRSNATQTRPTHCDASKSPSKSRPSATPSSKTNTNSPIKSSNISTTRIKCIKQCKLDNAMKDSHLECSLCQEQYHRACLKIKSTTTPRVWLCPYCKDIPCTVKNILETNADQQCIISEMTNDLGTLKTIVNQQKEMITELRLTVRSILVQPTCKCALNCNKEVASTTKATSNLSSNNNGSPSSTKRNDRPTSNESPSNENTANKTLLIGDSIIRDIKERGLNNTKVECIRRGKIKDVKQSLADNTISKSFKSIILHVGTNYCASDETFSNSINEYDSLVKQIKTDSPQTKMVISTVCPRSDDTRNPERVNSLNCGLKKIANTYKCQIIDNDDTFMLRNGSAAKANTNKGGLHLSYHGTRLLLGNIEGVHKILKSPLGSASSLKRTNDLGTLKTIVNQQKEMITELRLTVRSILVQPTCKCALNCNKEVASTTKATSNLSSNNNGSPSSTKRNDRPTSNESPSNENTANETLLIGDSIIRDIKERGLNNTKVECIRRGKIKDVKHTALKHRFLVRSPKLSNVGPGCVLDGRPSRNRGGCCIYWRVMV